MEKQKGNFSSKLNTVAVISSIFGTCVACIALIPAFGEWFFPDPSIEDINVIIRTTPTQVIVATDTPFKSVEAAPSFDTSGEIPAGGLADEETRIFAWASVQLVGIMSGCNTPTVEGTTITVTQQPDASGVWHEDWNVDCGDGTTMTFPIKFTPENGIVNVEVEFQP